MILDKGEEYVHLDILVVGQDAVVDDDELVAVVRSLGMRVPFGGDPVGGPSRMGDPAVNMMDSVKVQPLLGRLDLVLQGLDLALLLDQDGVLLAFAAVDPDAGAVVAAVLEPLEAADQEVDDLLARLRRQVVQVGEDPTHFELGLVFFVPLTEYNCNLQGKSNLN